MLAFSKLFLKIKARLGSVYYGFTLRLPRFTLGWLPCLDMAMAYSKISLPAGSHPIAVVHSIAMILLESIWTDRVHLVCALQYHIYTTTNISLFWLLLFIS